MDKLQKQILFWVGLAFVVILGAFVVVMTSRALETATTTNTVSFNGEGKVTSKPDIAVVDLSIVTDAKTSKAAQDDNSKKSTKLTEFLKSQGIDEKDIKTSSYNIQPQYSYPVYPYDKMTERPQIIGYQVNQTLEVKIRNLEKVDAVLDGVVATGVNQVYGLRFSIEEPEKLMEEARQKAITDAKEKADALEDQLGIRLGRIINFSESGNGSIPPFYYDKAMSLEGRGGGGDVPSVQIGENEIIVNVSITYQIK